MDKNTKINKNEPLVTILMLTYNRADFIKEAIASVKRQTYTNWKLIIIDDNSNDNTEEIINSFNETNITHIKHKTNRGLIERRKESLSYTTGEYTAVIDSDDIWINSNKLFEQVEFLEKNHDHAIIGTFISLINEQRKTIGQTKYKTKDTDIRNNILVRNQFAHSSVLIRNSIIAKTEGYRDTVLAEDYDLFLQLGQHGAFANLPKYYTAYRIHKNSFSSKKVLMYKSVLGIIKHHKTKYPHYTLALAKVYINIFVHSILSKFN